MTKAARAALGILGIAAASLALSAARPSRLGVRCGAGISGRPGVIDIQVSRNETPSRLRVMGIGAPDEDDVSEIEVQSAGKLVTCRATAPSPFLVEAVELRSATLRVGGRDSMLVEVRGPSRALLARGWIDPVKQDTLGLSF